MDTLVQNNSDLEDPDLDNDDDEEEEGDSQLGATQILGVNPMVKKLVRLALASEYSRQLIRRTDISQKVLGERSRQFKPVFAQAQQALEGVFGMQMIEQPVREKLSISQRRGIPTRSLPLPSSQSQSSPPS